MLITEFLKTQKKCFSASKVIPSLYSMSNLCSKIEQKNSLQTSGAALVLTARRGPRAPLISVNADLEVT